MGRIKLSLPKSFVFETSLKVAIGDINYGGHLGNDAYLRLAHEARIQFLKQQGWSEKDLDGLGLIMSDAGIQFKSEAFHGDTIKIEVAVDEISRRGFDLYYSFTNAGTQKAVASIKTGMLFFDYNSNKLASAPDKTQAKLLSLCAN